MTPAGRNSDFPCLLSQFPVSRLNISRPRQETEVPELSHGVNPRLPSASVGLEIQWSEERGRAFIATQDLSPGNW